MTPDIFRSSSFIAAAIFAGALPLAAADAVRGKDFYEKQVLPVLQQFCYDCHGDGMDKGNFALDKHGEFSASFADRKFWDNVREHVDTHVMPPDGKPQPGIEQRAAIVKWVEDDVFWIDPARPDPGHITLRRLNRVEYNNTVRDVFKVDSRPADSFPPDDTGYGYDNIGDVLTLSPLLMEKYLKAARQVAEKAVWLKNDERTLLSRDAHDFEDVTDTSDRLEDGVRNITSEGDIALKLEIPTSGIWRAELKISAEQAGPEKARIAVLLDGKEVRQFEVTADIHGDKHAKWQRLWFDLPMDKGSHSVTVRFLNDFYDEKFPDPKRRDRNLLVQHLELDGPLKIKAPDQSGLLNWLCNGKTLRPAALTLRGGDFDSGPTAMGIDKDSICLANEGFVHRAIEIPSDGTYRLRMTVGADQAGPEKARLKVKFGDQVLEEKRDITVPGAGHYQEWTFNVPLKKGAHDFHVEFLNNYGGKDGDRNAFFTEAIIEAPESAVQNLDRELLRRWIEWLGLRVLRRPLEEADSQKLNALADMVIGDGGSTLDALRLVCEAMLVSPKFLFRGGAQPVGPEQGGSLLVDEFTLASRLSYFLWSSAPDEELLRLAQKGELRKNLSQQVTRMIGDWKGWAMAENFAGQWLQLRDVELVSPSRRQFPEFEGGYASLMKKESQLFFDHIFRGNRSVLEFLDSDYTFVNEKLARFYNLPEKPKGKDFQQVSLKGTPRGGILTQGSVLTLTSHPNRTSPVLRGKFLLENILGTPPPPPPQDVPAFREDRGARVQGTLRQRFEAHRSNPSCASCHAFLDPMGFAFENYDAIGRWRPTDNGQPIDATGQLLTGQKFDGAEQLRKVLVSARKNEFTRCLVENLLTFSLGRGLDYPDKLFVKQITETAAGSGYKFQDIVQSVVQSVPFQRMRVPSAAKTAGAE